METLRFLFTSTFYPPYHFGGDAVHVEYLARELVKIGHEVHVFHSLDAYHVKKRQLPKTSSTGEERSDGIFLHTFKTHLRASPYAAYVLGNSPSIIKRFGILTKELKPEVVNHHNISLLGYGVLGKRGPYVNLYTAHDLWLICQQNYIPGNRFVNSCSSCCGCAIRNGKPPQMWRYRTGFKEAAQSIDLLIAPSNYFRRILGQSIKVKIVTLANFAPLPPNDIPQSPYSNYFLFVGRLEEHKGIINLIEVFAGIRKKTNARLLIVGEGSLKDRIEHFIRANSLDGSISYVGLARGKELYSLYKSARALIIPTVVPENSPLVAMEALSVGTPVIAANKGGLSDIIAKVGRGLSFNDSTELENILTNFSENKFPRETMKKVYDLNFSPPVYMDNYLKAIHDVYEEGN
jgi:glycosyltransferase involved in cell wall biosynthesis